MSKIHKELTQQSSKKANNPILKMGKEPEFLETFGDSSFIHSMDIY